MNPALATNDELDELAVRTDARQGEFMLKTVYNFVGRFVSYPSEHARVGHALWIVHTHLMDAWEATPRLAFLSPEPASGKTRAIEVTELLVPNPVCAVNVSPAYLFRKVGSDEGVTILFDEIDTVFGPKAKENEEIRGLLNAGHRRGAVAGRCVVRGKNIETEEIPAYSAVAVAGLGWLPDTILSRSIVIRMRFREALYARPCPKLPAEAVTTLAPCGRSCPTNRLVPRPLKLLIGFSVSSLRRTDSPKSRSRLGSFSNGDPRKTESITDLAFLILSLESLRCDSIVF